MIIKVYKINKINLNHYKNNINNYKVKNKDYWKLKNNKLKHLKLCVMMVNINKKSLNLNNNSQK
jgi:hypothetical protein